MYYVMLHKNGFGIGIEAADKRNGLFREYSSAGQRVSGRKLNFEDMWRNKGAGPGMEWEHWEAET
jgi:hypothetical protein